MVAAVREAAELGFRRVGVTGGEVFMAPGIASTLAEIAAILPTVVLTNGTLITDRLLRDLDPLAGDGRFALQLSLDSADAEHNDHLRGRGNFARVGAAVPRLLDAGFRVRIATTVEHQTDTELAALCELHRRWGIDDDDHIVRPVLRRGRAATGGSGSRRRRTSSCRSSR